MRSFLAILFASVLLSSCSTPPGPATKLERANVLPLALNDNFQFRKVKLFYSNYIGNNIRTQSEVLQFERRRLDFGAVNSTDRRERFGNYLDFFWRTSELADVTVRLEYRQAALGNYVMAQERYYPGAKGSYKSSFTIIGDDYLEFGRVTSWRAILISEGRIVAVRQSFMWR